MTSKAMASISKERPVANTSDGPFCIEIEHPDPQKRQLLTVSGNGERPNSLRNGDFAKLQDLPSQWVVSFPFSIRFLIARPTVAEERLKLPPNEDALLKLKKNYSDGTSHLVFSPVEFIEKLAALVPPPRAHPTRFHGCLAPHSKIRSAVVPKKKEEVEAEGAPPAEPTSSDASPSYTNFRGISRFLEAIPARRGALNFLFFKESTPLYRQIEYENYLYFCAYCPLCSSPIPS